MRIREKRSYATSNTRSATTTTVNNNNNNGITAAPYSTPRKPCTFAPSLLTNRRPSITSSNRPLTTQLGATTTTTTATIILPHQQQPEDDVTTNKKTLQHPSAPLCSSLRTTLSGGYSPLSTGGGSSQQQQQPKRPKILVATHLQPHMQHHLPSDQFFFNSLIKPQDRRGLPTFQYTQSTNKQHSFEQRFLSGTEDSLRNRGPVGIPPSRSKQQQQLKLPMYAKSKVLSDEDDFDVDYDTYDIDDERENGDEFHGDLFHEDHQGRIIWKHAPPSSQPILTKASIAAGQYHQSWGVHQRPSQPLPKLKLPNLGIVTCENFSSNYRQILRLLLDKDVLMSKAVDVAPASSSGGGGDGEDITNMSYGNLSLTQHNVPNAVSPVPPVISTNNTNGNSQSMVSGGGGMNKSVLRRFSSEIEQENKVKMLKQLKAEMEAVDVDLDDLDQDITHEVEMFQAKYKGGHGHVVGLVHEVGGEHHSLLGVLPHGDHNDTSMWDFEV